MKMARAIIALFLLASVSGCFDSDEFMPPDDEETGTELLIEETSRVTRIWADVRCVVGIDGHKQTFGRLTGSEDVWVRVVERQMFDDWDMVDGLGFESCSPGWHSSALSDSFCVQSDNYTACYSGGDGWVTQTAPPCEAPVAESDPWPEAMCDQDPADVGQHIWDTLLCGNGPHSACVAMSDDNAMLAYPTCVLDQMKPCHS